MSGEVARNEDSQVEQADLGDLIGRLASDEEMDRETRARLLGRLASQLAAGARSARKAGRGGGRWLTDVFVDVAPRIPVRDLGRLTEHHHGLTGEPLADALAKNACNATTAVGAAGGALAAVEFAAPPLLLTAPAQLVAETLVVAAIEVKLTAELYEAYGVQVPGDGKARAAVFLNGWAHQRGIDPTQPGTITIALGVAAKAGIRKRLMRTLGRHLTTLGPFLTGAVAGGTLNRVATRRLARAVRKDLIRQLGQAGPYDLPPAGPNLSLSA